MNNTTPHIPYIDGRKQLMTISRQHYENLVYTASGLNNELATLQKALELACADTIGSKHYMSYLEWAERELKEADNE